MKLDNVKRQIRRKNWPNICLHKVELVSSASVGPPYPGKEVETKERQTKQINGCWYNGRWVSGGNYFKQEVTNNMFSTCTLLYKPVSLLFLLCLCLSVCLSVSVFALSEGGGDSGVSRIRKDILLEAR